MLELVDGVSLEKLSQLSLDSEIVREVIAQVQAGLMALRAEGIHHGDLNPHNVLIARDGTVKLVDFGLANYTQDGERIGSPGFLAPERWAGEAPSMASDLYALGLLYHWLCDQNNQLLPENLSKTLMHLHPEQRKFLTTDSSASQKERLAKLVEQRLDPKFFAMTQRLPSVNPSGNGVHWVRAAVAAGLTCLFLGIWQGVGSMTRNLGVSTDPGVLRVRTNAWVSVQLDGKDYGFSPLELQLQPGVHRLRWRTSTRNGELQLQINPKETRVLTDSDFY